MAVIRVLEDDVGREGTDSDTGERTYTRTFTVETDSANNHVRDIKYASGLPNIGDEFSPPGGKKVIGNTCVYIKYQQTTNRKTWRVTATYSNRQDSYDERIEDPTVRSPFFEWSTITSTFPQVYDNQGRLIANTASDPMDPAITEEVSWQLLRVTRIQREFNEDFYINYENKLNNAVWNRKKKRQVKCRKINASNILESGSRFYRITFEFEIRKTFIPPNNIYIPDNATILREGETSLAWTRWILNRGFREKVYNILTQSYQLQHIHEPNTLLPVTSPFMLNAAGQRLPYGEDPIYLGYDTLEDIDFSLLNITIPEDHKP